MKGYRAKKIISLGLAFTMVGTIVGCNGSEPGGDLMADYHSEDLTVNGAGDVEEQGGAMIATMTDDNGCIVSSDRENFYEDGTIALSDFGVRLMQECFQGDKNVLISPLSVISALGMTANGAAGETLSQMEEVFRMKIPALNVFLKDYREALPDGEKYKMNLANGIWFRDSGEFKVDEEFLQTNAGYYNAGLYKLLLINQQRMKSMGG